MELTPVPEPNIDVAVDELDRGMSLPFMKDDDDEVDEYGLEGLRW